MARGRVITPDFWTDEKIIGLSSFARLFYLGLWNFAYCDEGHLPDEPLGLKLKILPNDPIDPAAIMGELLGAGRVARLNAGQKTFLWMPSFKKHQKSDPRWKTRCPACALQNSGELTETPASLGEHTETLPNSALREEKRTREKRTEEIKASVQDKPALDAEFVEWWKIYPRKQAKAPALKAFKRVRKTVPLKTLMDGVSAYALLNIGQDKTLIKLPAGWLNDARWEDEELLIAGSSNTTSPRGKDPMIFCLEHDGYTIPCGKCEREAQIPEGNQF